MVVINVQLGPTIVIVEVPLLKIASGALLALLRMNQVQQHAHALFRLHAKTNFHLQLMLRKGTQCHSLDDGKFARNKMIIDLYILQGFVLKKYKVCPYVV